MGAAAQSPIDLGQSFTDFQLSLDSSWGESIANQFRPLKRQSLSEWAEDKFRLSSEYSRVTGQLRLYGWQKGILDAFTDPTIQRLTVKCGVQLVKTLLIQVSFSYTVEKAPGPSLLIQPIERDAKDFSKERLAPMIRDNEVLRERIADSKQDGNTILNKEYPGGSLALVGSNAPGNLARRSIRYVWADEINKYPASSGKEGDPLSLARERTVTFGTSRKVVETCSPTTSNAPISIAYDQSDMRRPWIPCPACGTWQVLAWAQVKFDSGVADELRPSTAYYLCSNLECSHHWTDVERWRACESTEWRPDHPERTGHAGFWISHLYSPYKTIAQIVKEWLEAQASREKLQAFINTILAEDWEEPGEAPDAEVLYARRETYPHTEEATVPMRGLFLTAAVDVQEEPPRLEVEVEAWGRGHENWSIGYWLIQAFAENSQPLPVTSSEVWGKLHEFLMREFPHESGSRMAIYAMAIDTGKRPDPVYKFARSHAQPAYNPGSGLMFHSLRTVIPIKGNDDALKVISSVSNEDAARKRQGVRVVSLGTHRIKSELFDLLRNAHPALGNRAVPGCHHFPLYEMRYFEGLTSEKRVIKEDEDGSVKIEYIKKPGARNEPLDLQVYNRGAAAVVGIDRFTEAHWQQLEKTLGVVKAAQTLGPSESGGPETKSSFGDFQTQTQPQTQPQPQQQPQPQSNRPVQPIATPPQFRRGVRGSFL